MRKTYDRKAMKPVMPPTDAEDIEWRDVVGFEGRYEVSNYGHVRTIPHYVDNHTGRILLKARLLRPNVLQKGYLPEPSAPSGRRASAPCSAPVRTSGAASRTKDIGLSTSTEAHR
jgi:hypothetical protein